MHNLLSTDICGTALYLLSDFSHNHLNFNFDINLLRYFRHRFSLGFPFFRDFKYIFSKHYYFHLAVFTNAVFCFYENIFNNTIREKI